MKLYLLADVARLLGVSRSRVHALDDRLNPLRTPNGTRIYTQAAIDHEIGFRLAGAV